MIKLKPNGNDIENSVAKCIKSFAVFEFICGFIAGLALSDDKVSKYTSEFNWGTAMIWWGTTAISALFIYAFGEIIQLLYDIKMQSYGIEGVEEIKKMLISETEKDQETAQNQVPVNNQETIINQETMDSKETTIEVTEQNENNGNELSIEDLFGTHIRISEGQIQCNTCGAAQRADRKFCINCRKEFID